MNVNEQMLAPLVNALKRLERSKTKLTRRNALLEWGSAMRRLQSTVSRLYPRLRADGSEVVIKPRRGRRCPRCQVPMRTVSSLVAHLVNQHGEKGYDCPCGWQAKVDPAVTTPERQKIKHLSSVRDLDIHYAKAAVLESANRKYRQR